MLIAKDFYFFPLDSGIMTMGAINVVRGSRSSSEELLQIYNHSERFVWILIQQELICLHYYIYQVWFRLVIIFCTRRACHSTGQFLKCRTHEHIIRFLCSLVTISLFCFYKNCVTFVLCYWDLRPVKVLIETIFHI